MIRIHKATFHIKTQQRRGHAQRQFVSEASDVISDPSHGAPVNDKSGMLGA